MQVNLDMFKTFEAVVISLILGLFILCGSSIAQSATIQPVGGTLVIAIPVREGLVACSDKRLYNDQTGKFEDSFVKIRKVDDKTLFVATNTIGFLDRSTGKMEFNAFDVVSAYASRHPFSGGQQYWNGLKDEIKKELRAYLGKRKFEDWPETDVANSKLLFNLIFYSIAGNAARSYSLTVFYEKAKTPVIFMPGMYSETVKTPKLSGKGKEVMDYLARNPNIAADPAILRFDEDHFEISNINVSDAVTFATKLFVLTNTALTRAEVSSVHDCALLSYQSGFAWIDDSGNPIR